MWWSERRKYEIRFSSKLCHINRDILQQHDLSVARNSTNKKIFNNIVDKCMDDLKNTELRDQFDNDNQVKYFVRQSILYLIVK